MNLEEEERIAVPIQGRLLRQEGGRKSHHEPSAHRYSVAEAAARRLPPPRRRTKAKHSNADEGEVLRTFEFLPDARVLAPPDLPPNPHASRLCVSGRG